MKKIVVFLLTFGFIVAFVPSVSAGIRYTGKSPIWKCLKIPKNKAGVGLSCGSKEAGCSGQGVTGHRVKFIMSGLYPGVDTYLLGCVSTNEGNGICTTGDQTADNTVYGDWRNGQLVKPSTNLADLGKGFGYQFQGLFKKDGITQVTPPNPRMPQPSGELTKAGDWYEWQDFTPVSRRRRWLVLQYVDPKKAPIGKAGGNQQGTLDFDSALSQCASISWDPYGIIFDASTLEPIEGAKITLEVKKDNAFHMMTADDMLGGDIYNPQTTFTEGKFEYVVPDGTYKLVTEPTFLTDVSLIDPNYTKAYSEIYKGEEIIQQGEIQHRDVAIPTRNTNNPPTIVNFFYQSAPNGTITFDGDVSHPLTKLHIKTAKVSSKDPLLKTPYRTIGNFQADKVGHFKFDVDQSKFEETPEYTEVIAGLELEKVDLRKSDTIEITEPVKTVTKLEPIPQYLEGYAYDKFGKPLAKTSVSIIIPHSQAPYYETVTDEKGFYQITSDNLFGSNFTIKYTKDDNTEIVVSPSQFLAQNQTYLAKQKINPWIGRNSDGTATTDTTATSSKPSFGIDSGKDVREIPRIPTSTPLQDNKATSQILTLLVIIVLLTVGVAGIVLYLKKKPSQHF